LPLQQPAGGFDAPATVERWRRACHLNVTERNIDKIETNLYY
jgi:hypothetical protein